MGKYRSTPPSNDRQCDAAGHGMIMVDVLIRPICIGHPTGDVRSSISPPFLVLLSTGGAALQPPAYALIPERRQPEQGSAVIVKRMEPRLIAGSIRKRSWQTSKGEINFERGRRCHTKQQFTTTIELGYSSKWLQVTMGQETIALALGTYGPYSVTRRRPREDGGVGRSRGAVRRVDCSTGATYAS